MEIIREPDKPGEMWVRSDSVLFFYWREYHKTKDALVGSWMRTGDVMYFDEEGFLWHVGRTDDVFKVSGMWVSPLQVEGSLLRHPAIRDVAVVPQSDESDGLNYVKGLRGDGWGIHVDRGTQPGAPSIGEKGHRWL